MEETNPSMNGNDSVQSQTVRGMKLAIVGNDVKKTEMPPANHLEPNEPDYKSAAELPMKEGTGPSMCGNGAEATFEIQTFYERSEKKPNKANTQETTASRSKNDRGSKTNRHVGEKSTENQLNDTGSDTELDKAGSERTVRYQVTEDSDSAAAAKWLATLAQVIGSPSVEGCQQY